MKSLVRLAEGLMLLDEAAVKCDHDVRLEIERDGESYRDYIFVSKPVVVSASLTERLKDLGWAETKGGFIFDP